MGAFLNTLRNITEAVLGMLDGMPDLLALTIISLVSGVVMLVVFGLITPPHWMKRSRELMTAAMYEMRLYMDSPKRVLLGQGRLIFWAFAYTAAMLPAFIVLGVPFTLLLLHMEQRYGVEELPTNEPVLVRVDMKASTGVEAEGGPGVKLTAPPLVDETTNQAYVRVELTEPKSTVLKLTIDGEVVEKQLSADPEQAVYSPDRGKGLDLLYIFTDEDPIEHPLVQSIHIDYPAADQGWIPFALPWWAYWLIVSMVAAALLAKPLKVQL